ncbi:hypothetical protein [Streptomyces sp. NPDC017941]|uniref:hypothetical protein n=1 Tax=Streptomyces sp. NPDC017941 TaxID=3365018 RepID=UPI0037A1AB99
MAAGVLDHADAIGLPTPVRPVASGTGKQVQPCLRAKRLSFLSDMDLLGEAVERVCRQRDPEFRRINLEILGNTDPFLHAHVWPRFAWEPAEVVGKPVWLYPREQWSDERFGLGPQHDELRQAIGSELDRLRSLD